MAMTSWALGILLLVASYEIANAVPQLVDSVNVCQYKKLTNPGSPSGTYRVGTYTGGTIEVYCDMETEGGGYTFISPGSLYKLTSEELALMFNDKRSVRFCYRQSNGIQYCSTLKQLPAFSSVPLKLGLSEFIGYQAPMNLNNLGRPFMFVGFLPISQASNKNVQGMLVNGASLTFSNCDANPNSQIVLFPGCGNKPSDYLLGTDWNFCNQLFTRSLRQLPARNMPEYFFMFAEFHFGGCGCYSQTNRRLNVTGVTIGFK